MSGAPFPMMIKVKYSFSLWGSDTMKADEDIVLNTFVKSRLGIGLPPRPPSGRSGMTDSLTDKTGDLEVESGSLFRTVMEEKDERYLQKVLQEVGEDLDQMIDSIEEYRNYLRKLMGRDD